MNDVWLVWGSVCFDSLRLLHRHPADVPFLKKEKSNGRQGFVPLL